MTHPHKPLTLRARLIKTRGALLAVSLTLAGILLIALNGWLAGLDLHEWQWLHLLPLGELGGTLFGAGLLGTLFEYTFRREQEAATLDQFRQIIVEQAPAIRDAVVDGFATSPADLKRVATPELLDNLAANAMALRLNDPQFAREIYTSIRDQTIRASERWLDVDVNMRLSTMVERSASGASLLDVTVTVEYTTVPSHPVRRFVCTSDRDEHNALRHDAPATSAWYMTPRPGMDAGARENFELLSFTIDGGKREVHRQAKRTSQTYSVDLTAEHTGPSANSHPAGLPHGDACLGSSPVHRAGAAVTQLLSDCRLHQQPDHESARHRHRGDRAAGADLPQPSDNARQGARPRGTGLAPAKDRLHADLDVGKRTAPGRQS